MNDTKFINTYVDCSVGVIHEQIGQILQLKTQLKLLNDLIIEKDGVISGYQAEAQKLFNSEEEVQRLRALVDDLSKKNDFLTTISNQYTSLKQQLIETTRELDAAKAALMERNKSTIVRKKNEPLDTITNIKSKKETDDF